MALEKRKITNNLERSRNGIEAFETGREDSRGKEWSYMSDGGVITGVMFGYHTGYNIISYLVFQSVNRDGHVEYSDVLGSYHNTGAGETVFKVFIFHYFSSFNVFFFFFFFSLIW